MGKNVELPRYLPLEADSNKEGKSGFFCLMGSQSKSQIQSKLGKNRNKQRKFPVQIASFFGH